MKTLILGNGLIAKGIISRLLRANHEITVTSRNIDDTRDSVRYRRFTLEEMAGNKELFSGFDHVIHTISSSSPASSMTDIYEDARNNVLPNIRLFETAAGAGIKKFVFISSGGAVYGQPQGVHVDEQHPTRPVSAYGAAKLSSEIYLSLYGYHTGLDYLIVRPSNVYGYIKCLKKPQGVINHLINCAVSDKPFRLWSSLESQKDYLYVDDFADAILAALESGKPYGQNVYNVSYGETHSLQQIVGIIENTLGKKILIEKAEERKFDVKDIAVDSSLFKSHFNWKPHTSIESGISKILEQY